MTFSRETGKVKLPEDKKLYKSYSGWYTVIHVLGHKAPANADGTFGWTIVVEETLVGDGQRPPLRTWPFERQPSSMIMCKLNEAEKGMEQFAEAVLLPEYWDRFAPEAVQPGDDYVARIESLKQKPSVPEISGFLTQKNPLLAIEAAKKLVQIPEGRACLIDSAANGASGYRQAIFMELAIRNALEKEDEDACAEIKKIYESKESSYHVWGLALAAHRLLFKRARFSGGNTKAFARELLKSMRMDNFPASEVGERQYEELHEMLSAVRNEDNEEIKPEGDPEE